MFSTSKVFTYLIVFIFLSFNCSAEPTLLGKIDFPNSGAEEAINIAHKALEAEKALPFQYGPPATMKPTQELLGDLLLQLNRHKEAAEMYSAQLKKTPLRSRSLLGLARSLTKSSDTQATSNAYHQLEQILENADKDIKKFYLMQK